MKGHDSLPNHRQQPLSKVKSTRFTLSLFGSTSLLEVIPCTVPSTPKDAAAHHNSVKNNGRGRSLPVMVKHTL